MSGPTFVVFVGTLTGLLLGIAAILVWQESRRRSFDTTPAYVIDDLVGYVLAGLAPEVVERLGVTGVERVIDWEVRFLVRDGGVGVVAGGSDAAVAYIVDRILATHGVSYAPEDVRSVLALEAAYLVELGAVGEAVESDGSMDSAS